MVHQMNKHIECIKIIWTYFMTDSVPMISGNVGKYTFFLASSCSLFVIPFLKFILPMLNIFSLLSDMFCGTTGEFVS